MRHQTLIPWARKLTVLSALIALIATMYAFGATEPQEALAAPPHSNNVQTVSPDWKVAPTGLNVAAGNEAGELDLTWDAHAQTTKTLSDYRVTWTPDGEAFRPNSETDWYAYPTTNQVTVTDLAAGETYKVRVRARYDDNKKSRWSDVTTGQAAEAPADDKEEDEGSTTPKGPEPEEEGAAPSITPRSTHPTTPVAYAWSLRPSALGEDDEFRLIFISSQKRNAGFDQHQHLQQLDPEPGREADTPTSGPTETVSEQSSAPKMTTPVQTPG